MLASEVLSSDTTFPVQYMYRRSRPSIETPVHSWHWDHSPVDSPAAYRETGARGSRGGKIQADSGQCPCATFDDLCEEKGRPAARAAHGCCDEGREYRTVGTRARAASHASRKRVARRCYTAGRTARPRWHQLWARRASWILVGQAFRRPGHPFSARARPLELEGAKTFPTLDDVLRSSR